MKGRMYKGGQQAEESEKTIGKQDGTGQRCDQTEPSGNFTARKSSVSRAASEKTAHTKDVGSIVKAVHSSPSSSDESKSDPRDILICDSSSLRIVTTISTNLLQEVSIAKKEESVFTELSQSLSQRLTLPPVDRDISLMEENMSISDDCDTSGCANMDLSPVIPNQAQHRTDSLSSPTYRHILNQPWMYELSPACRKPLAIQLNRAILPDLQNPEQSCASVPVWEYRVNDVAHKCPRCPIILESRAFLENHIKMEHTKQTVFYCGHCKCANVSLK